MEASSFQFLTASADRASINIVHRLEQSRIELDGMVRFRKREFRQGCIELQLETLEEDRMIDRSVRTTPAQNAVTEDEVHALRLAINSTVECVQGFEEFHRRAGGYFRFHPFKARGFPTFQGSHPGRIVREFHEPLL